MTSYFRLFGYFLDPEKCQKQAWLVKEYILSEKCVNLKILMTGGRLPEIYTRKKSFSFEFFDQVLNG